MTSNKLPPARAALAPSPTVRRLDTPKAAAPDGLCRQAGSRSHATAADRVHPWLNCLIIRLLAAAKHRKEFIPNPPQRRDLKPRRLRQTGRPGPLRDRRRAPPPEDFGADRQV